MTTVRSYYAYSACFIYNVLNTRVEWGLWLRANLKITCSTVD